MQKIILALFIVLVSCNSENAEDCFQTSGETVEVEYEVPEFTKLRAEAEAVRLRLRLRLR